MTAAAPNPGPWKILCSYENLLPSDAADAEVVLNTAGALAGRGHQATLSVPKPPDASGDFGAEILRYYGIRTPLEITPVESFTRNIAAQHVYHAAHFPEHPRFRSADFIYARNPIVVMRSLQAGQRVMMDHYRPWGDQFPPLQPIFRRFMDHPKFLGLVVHSDYSRQSYLRLGVPAEKLRVVHNGFDPQRMQPVLSKEEARALLDLPPSVRVVTYAGRINEKKGLEVILELAARMPEVVFLLVGSTGQGPVEREAESMANVRVFPWQTSSAIAPYLYASDVLTIPPSSTPLEKVGNTVLPLKLFLYLASGRAIFAGATPDTAEILHHDENAWLVEPGDTADAEHELRVLLSDETRLRRLGEASRSQAESLTWKGRAAKIEQFISECLDREPGAFRVGSWSPRACALDTVKWIGEGLARGKWIYR
ncbi:MAG: glycosyltransferase family 4 protein [Myxococcota bacterium]